MITRLWDYFRKNPVYLLVVVLTMLVWMGAAMAQNWPEHRGDFKGVASNYIDSGGVALGDIDLDGNRLYADLSASANVFLEYSASQMLINSGGLAIALGGPLRGNSGAESYFASNLDIRGGLVRNSASVLSVGTACAAATGGIGDACFGLNVEVQGTVDGALAMTTATGPIIQDEAASATNPTLVPRKDDPDTGVGHRSANILSLSAGSTESVGWPANSATVANPPSEPHTCSAATSAKSIVYVDDTGDSGAAYWCTCIATGDDGAGTPNAWDWRRLDDLATACPDF